MHAHLSLTCNDAISCKIETWKTVSMTDNRGIVRQIRARHAVGTLHPFKILRQTCISWHGKVPRYIAAWERKPGNTAYSVVAVMLKNTGDTQVCTRRRRPGSPFQTVDSVSLLRRIGRVRVSGEFSYFYFSVIWAFYNKIVLNRYFLKPQKMPC